MILQEKINQDLKEAMKSGDSFRTGTLRMVSAAIHNREIEKKTKSGDSILTDEEVLEVLTREAKKRKEAAEIYLKGNRADLADKEKKELEIIGVYLPEQLGEAEIEKAVEAVLAKAGALTPKDFGKVMGEIMKELKGKADAGMVSGILKKKIGM